MMKVYICGAVTGLQREAVEKKFETASEMLKKRDFAVINPMKVISNPDASPKLAMKRLMPIMLSCDAIYLLSDWSFSEGAKIEVSLARYAGMKIMNEEDLN